MKKLSCLFFSSFILCTGFGQQNGTLTAESSDALYFKGLSYSSNGLLLKDVSKARNYFHQAAALGDARAMLSLGVQYSGEQGYQNGDSALYWYNEAALKGNYEAWFYLGNLYHFSQGGIIQDFARAYSIYEKGATTGDVKCLTMLGYYHFKGLAGKQDYVRAYSFFVQAAGKGNAMANYYLGLQYRNGYGVQRNEGKAKAFLTVASNLGEKQAKKELLISEGENPVVPLRPPQATLQNSSSKYQKIKHNLSEGSIKGTYKGYALRYDWSGSSIIGIAPLEVTFQTSGSNVTGTWKENDTETEILALVTDSALLFKNTQYNKVDHYSEFKGHIKFIAAAR
jgi:TPR repeat protein